MATNRAKTDPGEILYLTEAMVGTSSDADTMDGWAKWMGEMTRARVRSPIMGSAAL